MGSVCPYKGGLQRLPSTHKVVDFVPQLELLQRPPPITHGAGIAQLRYGDDGISIAYDQPGVPALAA